MNDIIKKSNTNAVVDLGSLIAAFHQAELSSDSTVLRVAKVNLLCHFYEWHDLAESVITGTTCL